MTSSLQDITEYHGLIRLNKVLFLDDITADTTLFKCGTLANGSIEIIPLFYCDNINVSEPSDDVLIFGTYKLIVPSDYNGLIHFQSAVDDEDCSYCVSFQSNSTLILIYNYLLENVPNKTFTVNYYQSTTLVYTYTGTSDQYGYDQHQVPSDITFNKLEVIV